MRRQKATVWCDRSQYEDPRLIAQQKAARMRADREIVGSASRASTGGGGGVGGSGSFTGGVSSLSGRGKIRHHGKGSSAVGTGLTPTALVGGVGVVPLRLSASEVGDEGGYDDGGDGDSAYLRTMTTTGGRSSMGSSSRHPHRISDGRIPPHAAYGNQNPYPGGTVGPGPGRFSGDATPSSNGSGGSDSMGDPTPMPHNYHHHHQHPHHPPQSNQQRVSISNDYFAHQGGTGNSGSSGERERERNFGGLGRMVEHSTESSSTLRDHHRPSQQSPQQEQQQQQQQRQAQAQQDQHEQLEQNQHQHPHQQTGNTTAGVGRRDSVDERTSTMTGIRLFVANPDP